MSVFVKLLVSRLPNTGRLIFVGILVFGLAANSHAHQTPNTIILLDIKPKAVSMELQLPLRELALAFGNDITRNPETLVERLGPQLRAYILAHVHPVTTNNLPWSVTVGEMKVQPAEQAVSGPYQEITIELLLVPPANYSTRTFILNYDAIIHEVINHSALVSIRNDWEGGIMADHPVEVGVIRIDTYSNKLVSLTVNLDEGSLLKGFKNMVALGTHHIAGGLDHLLFLLVLLLPAPLLFAKNKWLGFGGIRYSITRIVKIVTAFTIGHSITLLAGVIGFLRFPSQPIEVLIAVSILVSALHALRPIFPGKEIFVAAGFGLVHGLAFAGTLVSLNLAPGHMALSILGFNLGIELMQLFIILIIIPWLIMLSKTFVYPFVRIGGAVLAGVLAFGWVMERITVDSNTITLAGERLLSLAPTLVISLAAFAITISLLIHFNILRNRDFPLSNRK